MPELSPDDDELLVFVARPRRKLFSNREVNRGADGTSTAVWMQLPIVLTNILPRMNPLVTIKFAHLSIVDLVNDTPDILPWRREDISDPTLSHLRVPAEHQSVVSR